MYPIHKVINAEILNDTTTGGPALPTMGELNARVPSKAKWVWRGRRSLLFLPNGEFIAQVKLHKHLQPLLADPAPTASDVYLVTRPVRFTENPTGSLQHWSFHTQGIFYHLSAPDLPRDVTGKSQGATKSEDVGCSLKCEDLSNVNTEDYIRLHNLQSKKVLVAYKLGQTDYRPEQIMALARWTVEQLSVYGLFTANCQHFATTMVRRTIMRVGNRSAFAGTTLQIADWDFSRVQPHRNGIEHGFVVSPPLPGNAL